MFISSSYPTLLFSFFSIDDVRLMYRTLASDLCILMLLSEKTFRAANNVIICKGIIMNKERKRENILCSSDPLL